MFVIPNRKALCDRVGGLALAVLVLAAPGLRAEDPAWKEKLCRLPAGDFPLLDPSELSYRLSWNGILKAGETTIRLYSRGEDGDDPDEIYTLARTRSAGLARVLWPYDGKAESWVDRSRLVPIRAVQEEEDRRESNLYRTDFGETKVSNRWTTIEKEDGGRKEVRNRSYEQTDPPMHDLVSAMLYLRSLPLRGRDEPISVVCYPFRDPYLVTVTPKGRDEHEMLGREVPALKFGISLAKIQRDGSLKSYDKKMESAHFWITDDKRRIPLELKADIFIGSILVTLTEYREMKSASGLSPVAGSRPGRARSDLADSEDRRPERRRLRGSRKFRRGR